VLSQMMLVSADSCPLSFILFTLPHALTFHLILSYKGKLPESWEQDKDDFLIRAAYLVFKYNVPPELFLNMDETPLKHLASVRKTCAKKGAKNVSTQGGLDKRPATGTPWLNFEGDIVFFHTTIKGKTEGCLPNEEFRSRPAFKKLMFGHSDNHWVSKATMRDQVAQVELRVPKKRPDAISPKKRPACFVAQNGKFSLKNAENLGIM